MDLKKCYDILQLSPGATLADIKQAYRDLVKVWHPDRFAGSPRLIQKAERQLQDINTAYHQILVARQVVKPAGVSPARTAPAASRPEAARSSTSKMDPPPRSVSTKEYVWRRGLARFTDYLAWFLLLALTGVYELFVPFDPWLLGCTMGGTLLFAFVEANLLNLTGTTPGKWLWKVQVFRQVGRKPPLLNSLRRSLKVWYQGLALGFAPFTPVALAHTYSQYQEKPVIRWDREEGFQVVVTPLKGRPLYIAAGVLALLLLINGVLFKQALEFRHSLPSDAALHANGDLAGPRTPADEPPDVNLKGAEDSNDEVWQEIRSRFSFLPEEVQRLLETLSRQLQQVSGVEQQAALYLQRGELLLEAGLPDEARADYQRAIFLAPRNLAGYVARDTWLHQHLPDAGVGPWPWLPLSQMPYGHLIAHQFARCRRPVPQPTCRIGHDTQAIRQALQETYQVCQSTCQDFSRLPDGLRYVGLSGTARILQGIFEAADTAFANLYAPAISNRPPGATVTSLTFPGNAAAIEKPLQQVGDGIEDLRRKNYDYVEAAILNFVFDYLLLSQTLFLQHATNRQLFEQQQAQQDEERRLMEARQARELAERRARLTDGRQPVETLEDARWVYEAQDGMSFLIHPPLPPLKTELSDRFFVIQGTLAGLDAADPPSGNGEDMTFYNLVYRRNGETFRARFYLHPDVIGRQLQTGRQITFIGRLVDIQPSSPETAGLRFQPVFEVVYFELN